MSSIRELTMSACSGEITMYLPSESVIVTSGSRSLMVTGPLPLCAGTSQVFSTTASLMILRSISASSMPGPSGVASIASNSLIE
jgi:hypothetical protein